MAEKHFITGDIVQLKSGGPPMTVEDSNSLGVTCQWFDGSNKLQNGTFNTAMLEEPDEEGPAMGVFG